MAKDSSWPVTDLENKGPLKVLNGTKLILDDHGNNFDSFRISLESFRSFRGPLLLKPVTGQELFFASNEVSKSSHSKLCVLSEYCILNILVRQSSGGADSIDTNMQFVGPLPSKFVCCLVFESKIRWLRKGPSSLNSNQKIRICNKNFLATLAVWDQNWFIHAIWVVKI